MKKLSILLVALMLIGIVPVAYAQGGGGVVYSSGFQLQNLGSGTANVVIDFYDQTGKQVASVPDTIAVGTNKTYYPLNAVPSGFNGSAVVSSDQQLASISNVLGNGSQRGASYGGFTAGATTVNLPLVEKANYGINTWFNVQNTGSQPADVTVTYKPNNCQESFTIPANTSHTFDQSTNTCLPNKFVGAATVVSNNGQPIVAVVMQVSPAALFAYDGFTSASTLPVAPIFSSNWYHSGSSFNIQNTGSQSTDVTVTYTPSAGFPGNTCTETKTIAAGESMGFGFPQMPASCGTMMNGVSDAANGGFVGAAAVTANSTNQPLVGIVNQIRRDGGNGAAYEAIDPSKATSKVSMPLMMDRNYGWFTGLSVANVGTQATTVTCTYSNSSYSKTATLQPGTALADPLLGKANANGTYVGAGSCTATGGDAKIAAIVNEVNQNYPVANDSLLVYDGFNY
jgi:hypothetical protein